MKQRIDHSNYEAWLLDRFEGNLSSEQEQELSVFLALHPELDPGEGELPTIRGLDRTTSPLDKEALKRALPPIAKVDERNVEDHLIARLEGDLSSDQLDALRQFLVHHPEHQQTERMYALTKLVPEAMAFAHKRELARTLPPDGAPSRHTLDDLLVARLEGELTNDQERALIAYIDADPEAQRSWRLMQATRVRASDIRYADREALKKGGRVIAMTRTPWVVRLAAAASIALLIGMAWWWMRGDEQAPQVAQEEKGVVPVQETTSDDPEEVINASDQEENARDGEVIVPDDGAEPGRQEQPKQDEVTPDIVPPVHEPEAPIAEQVRPRPEVAPNAPSVPDEHPIIAPDPEPGALAMNTTPRAAAATEMRTVGQVLTGALRERVLDQQDDAHPLDGNDAVAAVDLGLKAVAGDRAGLTVPRDAKGRGRGFNLRLGRNLAITASR